MIIIQLIIIVNSNLFLLVTSSVGQVCFNTNSGKIFEPLSSALNLFLEENKK